MKIVDKRTGTSVDRRQDTISTGTVFSGRTDYGSILTVLLKTAGGVVGIHLIAIDWPDKTHGETLYLDYQPLDVELVIKGVLPAGG